jgi:hypothetical protein
VHDSFTVRIKKTVEIHDTLKNKAVIQLLLKGDKETAKSNWEGDWLQAKFRDFGTVRIIVDTVKPQLLPIGWSNGSNLRSASAIQFMAKDDVGELKNFRAELDGEWLMFSRKRDTFIYKFDEHCSPGSHELKVWVEDVAGNVTEKAFKFTR